jgi:hypothetical protein
MEALDRGETLRRASLVLKDSECGTSQHPRIELDVVADCDSGMSLYHCARKRHPGEKFPTWPAGGQEAAIFYHQTRMTYEFAEGAAEVLEWYRGYLLQTSRGFIECKLIFTGEMKEADDDDLAAACEGMRLD